jgi:signal transduction histidine kinase/PAS domain-containing protein
VHPDDRPLVSQAIAAAVKADASFELEFRILRPSGEVVWIFTNAKVLRENGRAVRMVGATVDISERKRSEHALRESEERISQLIALMPAAIYTCDADGHITFFNRRAAELWGREPRQGPAGELFTGTYRLWQPDGTLVARDQTPMAAAVRNGQSVRNAELIIERLDGTRVVVSANIEPLHDRYGRNSGAISVFQDISERKNAERELHDRNEAIQLLSETLEQLLRANDAETIVRNVFDKVAAHVGADSYFNFMVDGRGGPLELRSCFGVPDEIVEKISRLDSGQAICGAAAEAHQAIAANNIQNSDDEKVAFARSIGLQSYVCNPLMVGDNLFGTLAFASHIRRLFDVEHLEFLRIVSQYTAIALDRLRNATALRSSEDQLAEELTSMQQLHAMTTRLIAARDIPAALNEILDAVIAIQGADFGKVRIYNPALNGLEIVAQRGFEQSFIDRFRVVTVEDDSASGMAIRTKSRVVIEDVETEADYTPGRSAAVLGGYRAVQATPLISRSGDLLGLLLSHFRHPRRPTARELRFVDLYARQAADFIELLHTKQELRDSEERLRRQANELEQQLIASGRLVSLGEITASMAHEFNNPLGIVLGFVEDLLNSTPTEDPIHRPLQIIDDEAQRCKRIIQDLMDYSRPHATHLSQTKIPDLISKTLKLIENRLYKQKIKLTTAIAADLPRVHADYQQLEQVMVNLYLNAIDAMPRGGELAVSAQAHGSNGTGSVAIAVSDTGFGIDEETLARIFQPFYTAKKTRGLGLGLPICERIVKNHGGRIDVESQVGQGTTFKVIIPLTQGTA